jgi:hypothetical protein
VILAAGVAGVSEAVVAGVQGKFSWESWATTTLVAAGTTFITVGIGYGIGSATSNAVVKLAHTQAEMAKIHLMGKAVAVMCGAGFKAGSCATFRVIRGEEVKVFELLIEAASGALIAASAFDAGFENGITNFLQEEPGTYRMDSHNPKHSSCQLTYHCIDRPTHKGHVASLLDNTSENTMVITGTHGNRLGETCLKHPHLRVWKFAFEDQVSAWWATFKDPSRTVKVLDLGKFTSEQDALMAAEQIMRDHNIKRVIGAYCFSEKSQLLHRLACHGTQVDICTTDIEALQLLGHEAP